MLDVAMLVLLVLDSAMAMEIWAILVLGIWEPEDTMARGKPMLRPRLTHNTWLLLMLDIPMLVMVLAILVIPILPPMDMETLVILDVAMLVLDSAMDIPMLPLLEDAETILELLCHAKFEHFQTFTIPCLLPFVSNKKSI